MGVAPGSKTILFLLSQIGAANFRDDGHSSEFSAGPKSTAEIHIAIKNGNPIGIWDVF